MKVLDLLFSAVRSVNLIILYEKGMIHKEEYDVTYDVTYVFIKYKLSLVFLCPHFVLTM